MIFPRHLSQEVFSSIQVGRIDPTTSAEKHFRKRKETSKILDWQQRGEEGSLLRRQAGCPLSEAACCYWLWDGSVHLHLFGEAHQKLLLIH